MTETGDWPAVVGLIGNTPLVRLRGVARGLAPGVELYAKLEGANPGGSVKDRPAWNMVRLGLKTGALVPGRTILDATSGNTGLAYAMLGAALGHPVKLCVPANASPERFAILRAYGAAVVRTDPGESTDGAIREARRLVAADPERYFYADQYSNPANWQAHYEGTAPEIWRQTQGRITHFVVGMGTTGTLVGCGRRLRELAPGIRIVGCQPDSPLHGLEGWKHLASSMVPAIHDPTVADAQLEVATEEAQDCVRRLAREDGLLLSPSAGAACAAALRVARELQEGVVVTVFADDGMKYLSESFWGEAPS